MERHGMTQEEAQALVDKCAPILRLVHNTINEQAELGNPLAVMLKPGADELHAAAADLVVWAGLEITPEGSAGVRSGGGGK